MYATYSPEDNKLRLYAETRLDKETYLQAKEVGFKWAPKQELFVAPKWTPQREDFLLELCGEIGDEDTSLVERQEERADRFKDYSGKRAEEAEQAYNGAQKLADGIPFGQPILVGHHSEKRARKHAQKIENESRHAVNLWNTSQYWTDRAAGAIRHAKYKERPEVRARRIKKIEADRRKQARDIAEAEKFLKRYRDPEAIAYVMKDGRRFIVEFLQVWGSGLSWDDQKFLRNEELSIEDAVAKAIKQKEWCVDISNRWISHYDNRLAYEKAMLEEQGASHLLEKPKRPKQPPLLNYKAEEGFIMIPNIYHRGQMDKYPQVEMTKAEYAKIYGDYKGTHLVSGHRVRTAMIKNHQLVSVFLTDSKVHPRPKEEAQKPTPEPAPSPSRLMNTSGYVPPERTKFDDLKDSMKNGVPVVSAPQLFPTPEKIAEEMIELAEIEPGVRILEPSAGTGSLIKALPNIRPNGEVVAVELNMELCSILEPLADKVGHADFLSIEGPEAFVGFGSYSDKMGLFDRIVMNPPFENGADIKHITHALTFLNEGGTLVALCANGPRQMRQLQPLADFWETLPARSFKNQGTNVNVALMVVHK